MKDKTLFVIFLSEFDYQVQLLEHLYKNIRKRKEMLDQEGAGLELVESAGYWLHNL